MADVYDKAIAATTHGRDALTARKGDNRAVRAAASYLKKAVDLMDSVTAPAAGTTEYTKSENALNQIDLLKEKIRGYVKESLAGRVSELYSRVGGVKNSVEAETTRSRMASAFSKMTNTTTPKKIGSRIVSVRGYATDSKGYTTGMMKSLDDAGLKTPEDSRYQTELETRIANAETMLAAQQARHDGYLKDVARQASRHKSEGYEKRARSTRLKDLKRQGKVSGMKRDLAALSKRRV